MESNPSAEPNKKSEFSYTKKEIEPVLSLIGLKLLTSPALETDTDIDGTIKLSIPYDSPFNLKFADSEERRSPQGYKKDGNVGISVKFVKGEIFSRPEYEIKVFEMRTRNESTTASGDKLDHAVNLKSSQYKLVQDGENYRVFYEVTNDNDVEGQMPPIAHALPNRDFLIKNLERQLTSAK